mmetsp:Transcript_19127/g.53531  ORF Transcript_19127/g.53531 Transcript_19127/m.53531 type:complete len:247 (-) Transcript_19127:920-1660(-)
MLFSFTLLLPWRALSKSCTEMNPRLLRSNCLKSALSRPFFSSKEWFSVAALNSSKESSPSSSTSIPLNKLSISFRSALHPCLSSAFSSSSRVKSPEPETFMAPNIARTPTKYSASRLRMVRRRASFLNSCIFTKRRRRRRSKLPGGRALVPTTCLNHLCAKSSFTVALSSGSFVSINLMTSLASLDTSFQLSPSMHGSCCTTCMPSCILLLPLKGNSPLRSQYSITPADQMSLGKPHSMLNTSGAM